MIHVDVRVATQMKMKRARLLTAKRTFAYTWLFPFWKYKQTALLERVSRLFGRSLRRLRFYGPPTSSSERS